ncbi:MAG TPA: DUF624 domain-containing protein [Bacillus sp. (in: firmicutes)]|uniref:YesL family protein n=1 Tax=Bacillus litorisediminis TaxID=2922713 RepID=UPI001FAFD5A2|nr:DUF624 domain-containing protein [Bacillus litorisediminis]HWO78398.1 DUF624 domain-containing protein [Bacillus sp. (in: firmicutes)]
MNPTSGVLYRMMEWVTRFAFLNLLWIVFTLTGGLILGFFPATVSMFAIIRKWLMGEPDIPVFQTFLTYYKKEFFKSNLLGLFVGGIILLIGVDIFYMYANGIDILRITYYPLFIFIFLLILFLFYIFPAFVHFDLKILPLFKNAFLIMLIHPLHNLFILISLVSVFFIMREIPALFFIFGGSTYAFITMWLSLHAFHKIENKKKTA